VGCLISRDTSTDKTDRGRPSAPYLSSGNFGLFIILSCNRFSTIIGALHDDSLLWLARGAFFFSYSVAVVRIVQREAPAARLRRVVQ
jgi:hypothetical protein